MADSDVLLERDGEIAVVTLNRPERLNAMNGGLIQRLYEVLDEIAADDAIRAVVLTGSGRGFCSGTDLKEGGAGAPPASTIGGAYGNYAFQRKVAGLSVRMREIQQPIVAAVNGVAAGGGLALACAADVRVCSPSASFIVAFIRVGLSAGDMGVSWFLPRIVGPTHASRMMLTGCQVGSDEAHRIGLVADVAEDVVGAAKAIANEIASRSVLGVRLTKELLNASLGGASLDQMIEMENRSQILCVLSGSFGEASEAFRDRRRS